MQFSERELGSAINGNEEIKLTLCCLHLSDVDMKVTNRVALEALLDNGDHLVPQAFVKYHAAASSGVTTSVSDKEYSAAMHKGNRLAATKCVFEKQQLPPHLQAITRLSEDSLARL